MFNAEDYEIETLALTETHGKKLVYEKNNPSNRVVISYERGKAKEAAYEAAKILMERKEKADAE